MDARTNRPPGPLSAAFLDFLNNGGGSYEDFSQAYRLRVEGEERLPAKAPCEPEADPELRKAVRSLWRYEFQAEEKAKRKSARAEAGLKQPGRPRICVADADMLEKLRTEHPGRDCLDLLATAIRKEATRKANKKFSPRAFKRRVKRRVANAVAELERRKNTAPKIIYGPQ
jgi:hypothetical protein